jgi:hypothetical protein
LRTGRDHRGRLRPAYGRYLNPGAVPPRAGDLLVCAGPGLVHTAIVERVDARGVHVFQANVPPGWRGGKQVKAAYPLVLRRGVFALPPRDGLAVVGWIRPTGRDALP